ncbi:MAG: carboxypeptidase-like regulatory domain-containing protein [Planctomycetaceae bacterium]|nr:carboxypeptidase-like regulatory domain-containing protein [Planctomycetaceae bacterium]
MLSLTACREETLPGMPKRYPASLTVIQDGKPLADAQVVLINIDPNSNWSGGGNTDKNGVVQLRTLGQFNGIPEGTYKVGVSKIAYPAHIEIPAEVPYGDKEAMKEYNRLVKEYEDNTFIVVEQKFSIDNSNIQVTISPENLKTTVDVSPTVRIKCPSPPKG